MSTEKGINNLKLEGRNKVPIFTDDWIVGVEYKDNYYKKNNDKYVNEEQYYEYYNESEGEQAYERIDQEEINKLFAEPSDVNDNKNANTNYNGNPLANYVNNDGDKVPEYITSARPTKNPTEPER